MAVFSRITLLAGTAARCVHAMNRRGLAMANPTATFKTTKGEFKVELFQDQLPITTSNFKDLATSGFYDGLTFHRVIKGFTEAVSESIYINAVSRRFAETSHEKLFKFISGFSKSSSDKIFITCLAPIAYSPVEVSAIPIE